jgi:L-threonylcarbamoyladenylate synthase
VLLDGGACRVGMESTVVDVRGPMPVVLREGGVTREDLGVGDAAEEADLAASPGTRHRHYQPDCRVLLAPEGQGVALARAERAAGRRVGLVAPDPAPAGVLEVARPADTAALAAVLYDALRRAEAADVDVVVVEAVPEVGLGRAVMDRLRHAASAR